MSVAVERSYPRPLHPLHAVALAGTIPLFGGALLADVAYAYSYQIQWTNFASWLNAGGLVFGGLVLVWASVALLRGERHRWRPVVYALVLLALCIAGFLNSLVHARDAWGAMPLGLVLSAVCTVLACVATWIGLAGRRELQR